MSVVGIALRGFGKALRKVEKKAAMGGYIGPNIQGEYGGVNLSNPSYRKYYKGMI